MAVNYGSHLTHTLLPIAKLSFPLLLKLVLGGNGE